MKRLIKWAYFKYVYPEEVERAYQQLENEVLVWYPSEPMRRAMAERAYTPNDRLH